jgi:hypothetical protein
MFFTPRFHSRVKRPESRHISNAEWSQGPGSQVILLAIMRRLSFLGGGGGISDFIEAFSSRPRYALRKANSGIIASNIPPMLAAQSALPSGALLDFPKIFHQLICR